MVWFVTSTCMPSYLSNFSGIAFRNKGVYIQWFIFLGIDKAHKWASFLFNKKSSCNIYEICFIISKNEARLEASLILDDWTLSVGNS